MLLLTCINYITFLLFKTQLYTYAKYCSALPVRLNRSLAILALGMATTDIVGLKSMVSQAGEQLEMHSFSELWFTVIIMEHTYSHNKNISQEQIWKVQLILQGNMYEHHYRYKLSYTSINHILPCLQAHQYCSIHFKIIWDLKACLFCALV